MAALVRRMRRLIKAGPSKFPKPLWWDALTTDAIPIEVERAPKPPAIVFEEDKYIKYFYRKYPDELDEPISLLPGAELPPARRYAWTLMELLQSRSEFEAEVLADMEYLEFAKAREERIQRIRRRALKLRMEPPDEAKTEIERAQEFELAELQKAIRDGRVKNVLKPRRVEQMDYRQESTYLADKLLPIPGP